MGMVKKAALEIYRTFKQEIAKERIYDNTRGSSLLFEARTGVLRTKTYRAKYEGVDTVCNNASAHVALDNLTAVKLAFLPPNTPAIAQPLGQGIIRAVKKLYKKNLLREFLLAIECGKLFPIDLIDAIHLLEYSWRQVEATTVQNCFKRAGFSVCAGDADDASDTIDQTSDIVDEACKTLLAEVLESQGVTEGISFPDFRDTDSDADISGHVRRSHCCLGCPSVAK
ncbi:hypothetical protein HPB51_017659 [Rhipicephalus microplus]|uniref:DDE-1 domain-containing protein n=1 Tax=Rhipicephalus microplus TaxID=6941 RepID=A0A9J6E317_RHIMP|nr:hypothetical protein HPB51_017659 [Rhipicephalus microplus]